MYFGYFRDGPLENLWGGGVQAKHKKKKYSRKGKLNEKNSCTPTNPKKYSCYGLKKNSYKEFDNHKKFLRVENSPPSSPLSKRLEQAIISAPRNPFSSIVTHPFFVN